MAETNGAKHRDPLEQIEAEFGSNAGYVTALFSQYQLDPATIMPEWQHYFNRLLTGSNGNGEKVSTTISQTLRETPAFEIAREIEPAASLSSIGGLPTRGVIATANTIPQLPTTPQPAVIKESAATKEIAPSVDKPAQTSVPQATVMRGATRKLVENMEASLTVPIATSQRQIPLKALDENRRLINEFLTSQHLNKVSFTHIIAWAIVKTLTKFPRLNDGFSMIDGQPNRVQRDEINIGIAVDISKPDGSRTLMVPNIKGANRLSPSKFFQEYDALVSGSRAGKLAVSAYMDTTVTLTNPGTIGTTASNPRLMSGQGLIIATGGIEYPAHFQGIADDALSQLGISKVCTFSSTYDHRIIQGAESGTLLAEIHHLLLGEKGFYEEIFADLRIPFQPLRWARDRYPAILGGRHQQDAIEKQAKVLEMINAYRVRGHLIADTDPLQVPHRSHPELNIEYYGLTIWDLDREFSNEVMGSRRRSPLREILAVLRRAYCERVGVEYRHIQDTRERDWLRARIEAPRAIPTADVRKQILWKLISAELFERFLHTKYLGQKRFSIEGCETVLAMLDQLIEGAARRGVEDVTIGMSHRGRLNVLANVVGKFCERIFTSFEGSIHPKFSHDAGDVKYHQGAIGQRQTVDGYNVAITLAPNPSHLEFVDPVVEGMVRAKQEIQGPDRLRRVLPVLLHGDAAFAGEGIVAETLNLAQLEGYDTGGTIHIIVNNQIGFTTSPEHSRSSLYSTDVARMTQTPIFHVNGDDPDTAYAVLQIALDYRQEFHKDVVIDLVGYRRHGHNEADEPTYTHPILYQCVKEHIGVKAIYTNKLIADGTITAEEAETLVKQRNERYEAALAGAKAIVAKQSIMQREISCVSKYDVEEFGPEILATGISRTTIALISRALTEVNEGFHANAKLKPLLTRRASMGRGEVPIDWGFAEALAFGSLAVEGTGVRLSGQDCVRGTFSQRHAAYYDNETGKAWMPLNHITDDQAPCNVYDSMLSEAGVLGFEYGYSIISQKSLVLWEAQFGDFVNVAQVLIDQFIVSGEEKWNQQSRLVLLLPHGYEGMGPEHSSARPERFLQMCANNNIQVCMCSTPAQYFHLLRRQIKQTLSKPLIIFTPKSLLRLPAATSSLDEFVNGYFQPVLDEVAEPHNQVERVVFCSGKVYFDLLSARKDPKTRIVRLEQFYPLPSKDLQLVIARCSHTTDWVWAQEEPQNMGGWAFIAPRLSSLLPASKTLRYAGRAASASTATGYGLMHQREQHQLVHDALGLL